MSSERSLLILDDRCVHTTIHVHCAGCLCRLRVARAR
jgi:hypothetical protein